MGAARKIGGGMARACLVAIVALVPLILVPTWTDPLQLPKLEALEVLEVAALVGLAVELGPVGLLRAFRRTPGFWFAVVYLGLVWVSTATSIDPHSSFLGIFGRWAGAPTLTAYVLLAYLVAAGLRSPRALGRAAAASLAAACLVSLYGLGQYVGWDFMRWNVSWVDSAFSTMGNPDFLAAYELLYVFLASVLYLSGRAGRGARWALVAAGLCTAGLWATQTRSAWLVWIAAAALTARWAWRASRRTPEFGRRLRRWLAVMAVAVGAVLVAQPSIRSRVVSVVADLVGLSGYVYHANVTAQHNSMAQRVWIWRGAVHMVEARPVTGWGPDVMYEAFSRYQAAGKARVFPPNIVIDRAHNNFLQVAVDSGVPAAAVYAALLLAFLVAGIRGLAAEGGAGASARSALLAAAMAGGLAYWVEMAVNISMPASAPHAWFWLGAVGALAAGAGSGVAGDGGADGAGDGPGDEGGGSEGGGSEGGGSEGDGPGRGPVDDVDPGDPGAGADGGGPGDEGADGAGETAGDGSAGEGAAGGAARAGDRAEGGGESAGAGRVRERSDGASGPPAHGPGGG